MRTQPRNFRFWYPLNLDYVRITIKPGQRIHWHRFSRDEEGWSGESEVFELSEDGRSLINQFTSDGRDCDGRLTRGSDWEFRPDDGAYQPAYAEKREEDRPIDQKVNSRWRRKQHAMLCGLAPVEAGVFVIPNEHIVWPKFVPLRKEQRDEYAEAMNY